MTSRFTDLPPASLRKTHTRQAEAACASGTERNDGSSVPEGAGWEDVVDRMDDWLLDAKLCGGVSLAMSGLSGICLATDQTAGYVGAGFFAALTIMMLVFGRSSRRDIRAEFTELAKHKATRSIPRAPKPLRDEGEPAGVRETIAPAGHFPYQLDNEPLVPTNVTVFRRAP